MNKILKYILPAAALALSMGMSSCVNDLHVSPIDPSTQTEVEAEQLFNKCYANFGVAGNGGANGDCDVDDIDGGTSGLYRQMWNSNELTTDEAICGWGDEGIPSFCYNTYDASHPMLAGYYYRLCVGISYCNQYLKDFSEKDPTMNAEVRFLRALQYYLMMDAFGNVPFATSISSEKPVQYTRAQVYQFVESELLDIVGEGEGTDILADAQPHKKGDARYGRVDKAAGWLLLSRLYLNAKVYIDKEEWQKAADYAKKVMDSPYQLFTAGRTVSNVTTKYREEAKDGTVTEMENTTDWEFSAYQCLFMGDNDRTDAAYEAIFPILQDGLRTTSWGVSLFLTASTHDADMHDLLYDEWFPNQELRSVNGVSGQAWGGNRALPNLVRLFFPNDDAPEMASYDMPMMAGDDRALFNNIGRTLEIEDMTVFKNGYAVGKFNNLTTDGSATSDGTFPDMDTFLFRKAEAYLTYAEAKTRLAGGAGAPADALDALNQLRRRAHAEPFTSCSLDQILDEWGREFYFEGRRRVDLIRFGKFGGNTGYTWPWKGGVAQGRNFDVTRNIFAIPTNDLNTNSNLEQNPGYGR